MTEFKKRFLFTSSVIFAMASCNLLGSLQSRADDRSPKFAPREETLMTPTGETRTASVQWLFSPEEAAAYRPIGASNCFRQLTLDWNWQGGNIQDYFKRADPVEIAEFCKSIHLDAVVFMAMSHQGYTTYPSKLAPQFPAIAGRDFYGEVLHECHKRGIAVLGYCSLARNWWYDKIHPDQTWRWGPSERLVDLNSTYMEYLVELSQEYLRRYPVDGLRYDTLMQDPNSRNRWSQEKYQALYGEPLPPRWGPGDWRRMRDFQRWSTTRATRMLTEGNKAVKSDIETWQNGFIQQSVFDENDLEAGRFQDVGYIEAGDPFRQLLFMGVLRLKGTIVGHLFNMPAHTRRLCMALGARGYQFKAVNRETALPDDREWYAKNVAPFYEMIEQVQPFLKGARPVPYVGVLYAEATRYRSFDYNRDWYVYGILKPLAMTWLARSRVVEFLCNLDLPSDDFSHLPVIIVPETSGLKPAEIEGLRRYVRQGGQLLVAGEALRYDERGIPRKDFALAREMGVSFVAVEHGGVWNWCNATFSPSVRAGIVIPKAGKHNLSVWMRESRARVDQLLLTRDADFRPDGIMRPGRFKQSVVIEAEDFNESIPGDNFEWKCRKDLEGYSGDGAVQALLHKGQVTEGAVGDTTPNKRIDSPAASPELRYEIDFPKAGVYYVWVRQSHTDAGDDSIYLGLNSKEALAMNFGAAESNAAAGTIHFTAPCALPDLRLPASTVANPIVHVQPKAGRTILRVAGAGKSRPLLHVNPFGNGRIAYLAASNDLKLMQAVVEALVGSGPANPEPAAKQVILTRQPQNNRWVLHLIGDGDYSVNIDGRFCDPVAIAAQYPTQGWTAELKKTEAGARVEVRGNAENRLLILK